MQGHQLLKYCPYCGIPLSPRGGENFGETQYRHANEQRTFNVQDPNRSRDEQNWLYAIHQAPEEFRASANITCLRCGEEWEEHFTIVRTYGENYPFSTQKPSITIPLFCYKCKGEFSSRNA